MTQYIIKQVEEMAIKEDHDEYPIFTDINRRNLEIYNNYINTHDVTT